MGKPSAWTLTTRLAKNRTSSGNQVHHWPREKISANEGQTGRVRRFFFQRTKPATQATEATQASVGWSGLNPASDAHSSKRPTAPQPSAPLNPATSHHAFCSAPKMAEQTT